MLTTGLHEGLIGALDDALRADIDPRAGGHLAVHGKTLLIQLVEVIPGRPVRHEIGVGDQHPRSILVRAEDADRLAGLDEEGLVFVEVLQCRDDAVEIGPGAGCAADAAIDDELVRIFGDIRVEIVHQHAERRFRQPALGADLGAARAAHFANIVARIVHVHASLPVLLSSLATVSMRSRMAFSGRRSLSAFALSKAKGGASVARCVDCASSIWIACTPCSGRP